ncbi:translocation/assembly module TamB domain-containing protein [Alteromonas sp. AMM-1]|uniref:translocation/assembly module TamB domain-containing protein n=1 Tax=Alteromonas sp. AMM-1 TaxID=3394233 RepID=UPI0039A56F65
MSINRLAKVFLYVVVSIVTLVGVCVSPLGMPLVQYAVNHSVPGLSVSSLSGSVWSKIIIENLAWHNEQWQVQVPRIEVEHDWTCLLNSTTCIRALTINQPAIEQLAEAPATTSADEPVGEIELPVSILLDQLTMTDINVSAFAGSVSVERISTKAQWVSNLEVAHFHTDNITVRLPASEVNAAPATPSASFNYEPPVLPAITMPLLVNLSDIAINNLAVYQGESLLTQLTLTLDKAALKKRQFEWQQFSVNAPQGQARSSGQIAFTGSYPLTLTAEGSSALADFPQSASVAVNGDMSNLQLAVAATGTVSANAQLQTNLLDSELPLALQLTWPEQSLQPIQDMQLAAGALSVSGRMGQYALAGNTAVSGKDIPATKVDIQAVLGDRSLVISALNADLLKGTITNSGVLYFGDVLSWEGLTRIQSLELNSLHPQAPSMLDGILKTQISMTNRGPNVLVSDIQLSGVQYEREFQLEGDAVYSANSDIVVGNLTAQLADNEVSAIGQVFKQQYIDALVTLNLPHLSYLYPEVKGGIQGSVNIEGIWDNPTIQSALTLQDVALSPTLSEAIAKQGPLNGSIDIAGSLAEHTLSSSLQLPDYNSELNLTGAWQKGIWRGRLSDTKLAVVNTRWELNSDVELMFAQSPLQFEISAHCWESREHGELCINAANYNPKQVLWDVSATNLPLGLWAYELAPDILFERNDATLSFSSQGKLDVKSQKAQAKITADISSEDWRLGPKGEVLIAVDTFALNGNWANDQLIFDADVNSPQVGEIAANLTLLPLAQTPGIAGTVNINHWKLAPFKSLLPNMNALDGEIDGALVLNGALALPEINGELSIRDGHIDSDDLPVKVSQWQQTITLNGDNATFNGQYMLGDGAGTLTGDVSWRDVPEVNFTVAGDAFTVQYDDSKVKVSPDLTAYITPQKIEIKGSVDVPYARIKVNELPASAIAPSKDVHLRGEPPSDALIDQIHANVMVTIDDAKTQEVKLDAFGLTASLSGGIRVQTQPALTGFGDLQILNGRYQAYGQNLLIRTGEVQFNGPIDEPMLLVEAIRDPDLTADDVVAGVRIEGPATQPSVNLFSEPAMDQAQNLAYLLSGSGSLGGSNSEMDQNAYASLLIGFGLSSSEGLTSSVGDALGIEDFTVSTTGQGDNTKLAISGKIARNLTVRYGVGMFSNEDSGGQEVALRYQIMNNLYIEVVRSLHTAVDLYYQFTLGKRGKEDQNNPTAPAPAQ